MMKGAKWRALFCFIAAIAAGCFAAACAEEHVHEYEAVVTPPTCTEQGYTTYTCPEDGESYVDDYVEPLGHTPAAAVRENEAAATCTEAGSYEEVVYCSVCEEEISRKRVQTEAFGHEWDEGTLTTAPTCTQEGVRTFRCTRCSEVKTETAAATGHIPGPEATCTQAQVCLQCDAVLAEALGHDWDEGTTEHEATCLQEGSVLYACSRCDEVRRESTPKGAHTPETVPGKAATCTDDGLTEGSKCSVCGTVLKEQEEIPAKGHTPSEAKKENEKAATCTTEGSYDEVVYCSVCGEEISRKQVTVEKAEHTPGTAVKENEKAATCTTEGSYEEVVYCTVCDEELSREQATVEKLPHTPEVVPGKAATCTETGLTDGERCSVCGAVLKAQKEIPALDHSFTNYISNNDATCTQDGTETAKCDRCEETNTRTVEGSAKGHDYTNVTPVWTWTLYTEATAVFTCTREGCGHEEKISAEISDKVTTDATCTTEGVRTYTAQVTLSGQNYTDTRTETIPALAHDFVNNVCTVCGGIDMSKPEKGSGSTVAVHDPSVIIAYADSYGIVYPEGGDGRQKVYFVFGTQLAAAYSFDMESWVAFTPTFYEEGTTTVSNDYYKVFQTVADWSGYKTSETVLGNTWAPDIIYNPELEEWCVYYSLSGDGNEHKQSSVYLMTSSSITGPYVYAGSVVYSGMTNNTSGAGNADYEKVTGVSTIPDRYLTKGAWSNNYGVHCIDPAVMYDEAGELWLFYGSWSGGIALLKLDNQTGLRDLNYNYGYEGNDAVWEGTSLVYDPYMGIHIAGGWWVSGEGPYVEYIDGYYYLFMSYGGYAPDGGYNMRVFRSKDIRGRYTDPDGTWAVFGSGGNNFGADVSHGLSFMQNYKWSWWTGPASLSQGHNSAVVDSDGNAYLVYHIKYDDGTIQHNVEVHRLVKAAAGEDSWYLVAPFQKSEHDRILTGATAGLVAGNWNVLIHKPIANYGAMAYNTDVAVTLNADGTVSGAYKGTWSVDGQYITITLDGEGTFSGVLMEQQVEGIEGKQIAYTFTAMNDSSLCVWGARFTDELAAQLMADRITFPDTILGDLDFETQGLWGTTIAYSSSNTDVLANDGKFTAPATDTELTLTVTVSIGSASIFQTKTFTIKGLSEASILGMLPEAIRDDGYLVKAEPGAGGSIAPIGELSNYTGVSFTFRVKDVATDWDVMFRTANGTQVYLSVLNYNNANTFEASATLTEEAKAILQEHGLATDGSQSWQLFLGSLCEGGECVATISYNVDGSIAFYRNGVLMLTYAADTPIGTGTVRGLVDSMIAQVRTQGLSVVYPVSNVIIGYAADYDENKVPEERPVIETLGTDNGDGTYELAFGVWRQTQNVQGDFKVVYDINVKAPSASTAWFNWVLKIGNDWALRADHYSGNLNSAFAQITEVQYSAERSPNYVNAYLDADVILTIQRTGLSVVVTIDATSLSTGEEFTYTATYASFGAQDTTVSLGGENCLINVYKVTAESGEGPVEPPHEHSFGEYADDVATCSCGATKVKYVVGSTTAEVIFESRENAEVVTNTDTSGEWWDSGPMGQKQISGDFAIQYSWTNTRDVNWYQDVVLELTDGTNYLTKNFFIEALVNTDNVPQLWTASDTAKRSTTTTHNGETATLPAQNTGSSFEGDYTASIVRIDSTLIIMQTLVLTNGDVWQVEDVFTGFSTVDLTVQLTGNPYWVDDLRVTVGEMKKNGTTAMDEKLGAEDNSTGYTGEAPLWTSTIKQGQKITVTGTATSSGENAWNAPLAYLWTGETASINFRLDNYVNGADATPDQANGTANVSSFGLQIVKNYLGFLPETLNAADLAPVLKEWLGKGEYDCTIVWDYTSSEQIIVGFEVVRGEESFRQQYTITPQSGNLLDTYSIGLGVDFAYYHVTGMTVE